VSKRERFLEWLRHGSADQVPVLFGPCHFEVASARLGKPQSEVTWPEAIAVAEETGTHLLQCVGSPLPFDAVPFLDDIQIRTVQETRPDGTPVTRRLLQTPAGTLTEAVEYSPQHGACHTEFFVKGDDDLPAFAYFIRKTTAAVVRNPAIRRQVSADIERERAAGNGRLPTLLWPFCAAVELTSSYYMDQATAIYTLHDYPDLLQELMESHWAMTQVWLELGIQHGVDIFGYAINGFEWLSPDLYQRYMIPQARRLNEFATAHGKLSWLHTCGRMKRIAAMGAYQEMKIDVLESLSSPPTGDIDDLAETRRRIGPAIVTRGGINCEWLYQDDPATLRRRTRHVLESVRGFRHAMGDTNSSVPSYPWANIKAVIDAVRESGRLYE
jgi:uroporphyrinogen-III decarboxylase